MTLNGEALVMLELWGMQSTPSSQVHSGPEWPHLIECCSLKWSLVTAGRASILTIYHIVLDLEVQTDRTMSGKGMTMSYYFVMFIEK